MKTNLNFDDTDTKELLSKLDFEFFLKQNIEVEKYSQEEVQSIYSSFSETSKQIKIKAKENKRQFNFYADGRVRQMFLGGFLPSLFYLDESTRQSFLAFSSIGESWAYFNYWQKRQKRKITKGKMWDLLIKCGSVLAILLSFLKLLELIL